MVMSGSVVESVATAGLAATPPLLVSGMSRSTVSPVSNTPSPLPIVPPTPSSSMTGSPCTTAGPAPVVMDMSAW